MKLTSAIPAPYRLALLGLFAVALIAFGWVKGATSVQRKWDAADGHRARAEVAAIQERIAENKREAARQVAINEKITKGKDHEIAQLTARLASAGRLRIGTAICGGPAAPAETAVPSGGDGADSPARLVRSDIDRDFKALILAVETDLATGRACQAAAREHGFAQ